MASIVLSHEQLELVANYIRENVPDRYEKIIINNDDFSYYVLFRQQLPLDTICSIYYIIKLDFSKTSYDDDVIISEQIIQHIRADPWQTFGKPSI
jgi:hypothetical protein